jgi:hypothetical protein
MAFTDADRAKAKLVRQSKKKDGPLRERMVSFRLTPQEHYFMKAFGLGSITKAVKEMIKFHVEHNPELKEIYDSYDKQVDKEIRAAPSTKDFNKTIAVEIRKIAKDI